MAFYPYYPQPLNPYPQTPVQPYQDRLTQLQNNYQQTMPYGQAQMQQPVQQMPQISGLPGQMVDGIDTVKAKDVDMTGNPVYYPKTDGTEIYKKQLQADGRSRIFVYRLLNPDEQQQPKSEEKQIDIEAMFNQLRNDVCSEISEIKNMFPTQMSVTPEANENAVKLNKLQSEKYGSHFIDAKYLLINYGLQSMGITPTEQDKTDIADNRVPTSLRSDNIHLNAKGYSYISKIVYQKGASLKYWYN